MNTTNGANTHFIATCTEAGLGYGGQFVSAWTQWFLIAGLMMEYDGIDVSMEDNFAYTQPLYVSDATKTNENFDPSVDYPVEYDGNTGTPFYLGVLSHSIDNSWFRVAEATTSKENKTLGKNLSGTVSARVSVTDWSKTEERTVETGELNDANALGEAFKLMNPNQRVSDVAAMCLFSHSIDYLDNNDQLIARVGLCQLPEFKDSHPAVLVKIDEDGKTTSRQGLVITNAEELSVIIEQAVR